MPQTCSCAGLCWVPPASPVTQGALKTNNKNPNLNDFEKNDFLRKRLNILEKELSTGSQQLLMQSSIEVDGLGEGTALIIT